MSHMNTAVSARDKRGNERELPRDTGGDYGRVGLDRKEATQGRVSSQDTHISSYKASTAASHASIDSGPWEEVEPCDDLVLYNAYDGCWTAAPKHYGEIPFCQGDKHTTPFRVCEGCVDMIQRMFESNFPALLEKKWLPLCIACTTRAKEDILSGVGFTGCRCPLDDPNSEGEKEKHRRGDGKLWCHGCRRGELEKGRLKYDTEVDMRRGPIGTIYDRGETGTLSIGVVCLCGNGFPDGPTPQGCSKRCGGCGGLDYGA